MLDILRFCLAAALVAGGLFVVITGVVGVFRFRYSLSRIHAGALLDTLGIALIVAGVIVAEGFTVTSLKLALVALLLWLTSPVSSHLIGRMEITINDDLEKDMVILDRRSVDHEKEGD